MRRLSFGRSRGHKPRHIRRFVGVSVDGSHARGLTCIALLRATLPVLGSTRRLLGTLLGLFAAAPFAWAAVVALRVYRFESSFYQPARRKPARPALPELAALQDVSFTSGDGARVAAWYQPPRDAHGPAVVLAHGVPGDREGLIAPAALLARHGYGVLLFDWPGYGESGGSVTYGAAELLALRAALDWLAARPEVAPARLGGLGCSLGGYMLLALAADDARLRAVAAEGAPTSLLEVLDWQYRRSAPVGPWAARLAAWRAGVDLGVTDALRGLPRVSPRALLLIGSRDDEAVPADMSARLYAAAGEPKELWLVDGAAHCGAQAQAPAEYERRVLAFFERALAGHEAAR